MINTAEDSRKTKVSFIGTKKHHIKNRTNGIKEQTNTTDFKYDNNLTSRVPTPTQSIGGGTAPQTNGYIKVRTQGNADKVIMNSGINQKVVSMQNINGVPVYLAMNQSGAPTIDDLMENIHKTLNLPTKEYNSYYQAFKQTTDYYNRFKVINPNEYLIRGIPHVFFVRPCCNIFKDTSSANNLELVDELQNNEKFVYAYYSCPEALKELSLYGHSGTNHHFMLSLSNHIKGFPLNAEYINTDTYGRTFTGYKIAYGKNNIESKTASNIELTFNDDRNLHVYQIHQLWIEYINGVYRGMFSPRKSDIFNKILDYTGAIYYILTAEDGETVIYWCKFYGVFPTTAPSDQFSWAAGQFIVAPEISISYQYSFKEEYNPASLVELNYNAGIKNSNDKASLPVYEATYDPKLGHTGSTWVGVPFIETIEDPTAGQPLTYKLRFKNTNKS